MAAADLLERISTDPNIMVGKPVIKGTRLPVEFILKLMAHNATAEQLWNDYKLTADDISACRLYAKVLSKTRGG